MQIFLHAIYNVDKKSKLVTLTGYCFYQPSISDKSILYFDLRSGYVTEAAGISRLGTGTG